MVRLFANVALVEGISYILLLGIAMPLKYVFEKPMLVTVVGWAHGVLFVAYGALLVACWARYRWSFGRAVWYFFASLLPVVPFFVERALRREYRQA